MATDKKIPSNLVFSKEKFRYNTIQDVINDTGLTVGLVVETDGYNTLGDGFDAKYLITNVNEQGSIPLTNGYYAKEVPNSNGSKKLDKVNTIEELKSQNLKVGDVIEVLGYYRFDDGATHKRKIAREDDGSGVQLANKLWANIVHNGEVNVSWFGAKGDGVTDDTSYFNKIFKLSGITKIMCSSNKIYYFTNIINARKIINSFTFDGMNSTFKNFCVELSLKDDSYDWRSAYNHNIALFRNCIFGSGEWGKLDNSPFKPNIISGMPVHIEHCALSNRYVLLAYVQRYIDILKITDLSKTGNWEEFDLQFDSKSSTPIYEYDAVMTIKQNGDLILKKDLSLSENEYTTSGDGWKFEGVNEIWSNINNQNKKYGLVTLTANQPAEFTNCIQIHVTANKYVISSFNNCHLEKSNTGYTALTKIVKAKFDNCYFYAHSQIPFGKNEITYTNCYFRIDDSSEKYTFNKDKSLLKNSHMINCRFSIDKNISLNSETKVYLKNNYSNVLDYANFYVEKFNTVKGSGINANCHITVFFKNLFDTKSYYKKIVQDFVLTDSEIVSIFVINYGGCEIDFYLEIDGKIYFNSVKTSNVFLSERIKLYKSFFVVELNKRNELFSEDTNAYPLADTYDIVDVIPNYMHLPTVFGVGENLYVDTNNSALISGLIRINKESITKSSGSLVTIQNQSPVQQLNTPYHTEKMKQEGVYNDFITYMDEKTAYDKQERKLEQDRQLAYEEALKENPNLTYEEFMSVQPMTLNLVEEPQPSEALKKFMDKYL